MKKLVGSAALLGLLIGCGSEGADSARAPSPNGALSLVEGSMNAIEGTYLSEGNMVLSFSAHVDDAGLSLDVADGAGTFVTVRSEGLEYGFVFAGVAVSAISDSHATAEPVADLVASDRWSAFEGLVEALDAALPHDDSPRSILRKTFFDVEATAELLASTTEDEAAYCCWCSQWQSWCEQDPGCMSSSAGGCRTVCYSECTSWYCH
jgi:hypothetical protein